MKSNTSKCHLLIASTGLPEHIWIKAGDQIIWESSQEKLLGVSIDKNLKFDQHIINICKIARAKVTALSRLIKIVPLEKKRTLMKSYFLILIPKTSLIKRIFTT